MKTFKGMLFCASAIALGGSLVAHAQEADDGERKLGTVTVTGSFIQGTPEDAALPVDVLTAADLKLEGSPSITELIRNLGPSSGVDGQTNQFASNGLEGTSNVNLRGLGPARTLVLINGHRQTYSPFAVGEQAQLFIDTNMIPKAAIGRVEVLKDGAAALYGSDAIAGVVNFITRDDLDGLEVGGSFSTWDGNDDGDYEVSAAYGMQGGDWNWVTSVGYTYQSEVLFSEKDWAIPDISDNPVAGFSSLSNPGRYVALGPTGAVAGAVNIDQGCTTVGGVVNPANGQCYFQFTQFDNLQEETERYQIFSEFNRTLSFGDLHLEALYGKSEVPSWNTSPSYPPQVLTNQFVPANHPGLQQYISDFPGDAVIGAGVGALYIGRSFGWGGFPGTGFAQEGSREHETYRLAGGLAGEWGNGVSYDFDVGYSNAKAKTQTNDTYIQGLTAALRGFGVCTDPVTGFDPATGTAPYAAGYTGSLVAGGGACQYYNPFSNAIAAGAVTGTPNPNFNPALANTPALADWMTDFGSDVEVTNDLFVADAVFSGQSGVQAGGGEVGWAAGVQFRRESRKVDPSDLTNLAVTPGPGGTGAFSFLAGTTASDADQSIFAVFGELQIPLYENLSIQVATRYEDYGGEIGSTFDPKVAAKWQATSNLALRGSAQTSFKGPTLNQLAGVGTTLQFVAPTSAFKAVDQFGNPDLKPESAFSYNFGAIFQADNFNASLDYYSFDFSDPVIVEEQTNIVAAAVAALATPSTADDAILNRITFNDPLLPSANTIARIRTGVVNGPDIQTSGLDLRINNTWDGLIGGGDLTLGLDGTYVIEYEVDAYIVEGVSIGGGDYAGQFNRSNFTRSLPQLKANIFGNLALGDHNIRGVVRYINSYDDERGTPSLTGAFTGGPSKIDSQTTLDLFYNWQAPFDFDLGLSVVNVFDQDPPAAYFDTAYDPYTHNPFGRTFKISVTKRFGAGS
ncbi:MAG: TonB-dependent receptor [Hyphomonas sp.]